MPTRQVQILTGLAVSILVVLAVVAFTMMGGGDDDPASMPMTAATTTPDDLNASASTTTDAVATSDTPATTEAGPPATAATQPPATTAPPPVTTQPLPATTASSPVTTEPVPTATTPPPPATTQPQPAEPLPVVSPCAAEEPARALPAGATDQTTTVVDLDQDGVDETIRIYYDPSTGHWFARSEYADGWATEVVLDDTYRGRIVGWRTFGSDRLVVTEARVDGQMTSYVFLTYRNCRVSAVQGDRGSFVVEAGRVWGDSGIATADSVRCDAEGLTLTSVRPGDPGGTGWPYDYQVTSTGYTWNGQTFVEDELSISTALCCDLPADRDIIMSVTGLDC